MRKKLNFTMAVRESAMDAFGRFLLTKCAGGVKTKTIETYSQHFHAISKHLDVSQEKMRPKLGQKRRELSYHLLSI